MRILKCYLANSSSGRFVTSKEAAVAGTADTWTCASCVLHLHSLNPGKEPWFEHDQCTVSTSVLMSCTHLDPEVKAEIRRKKLQNIVDGLAPAEVALSWVCVWCGDHYRGEKHCIACGTGIYSTELENWLLRRN